jgi:5-methylcytosine-specific restriction endonuclease McrA
MPTRLCLRCGESTSRPSRRGYCPPCQAAHELERPGRKVYDDPAWRQLSARAVRRWVREHGWACPGYGRGPHLSHDLTGDHPVALAAGGAALPALEDVGVLCRSCNGRKAATPATKENP